MAITVLSHDICRQLEESRTLLQKAIAEKRDAMCDENYDSMSVALIRDIKALEFVNQAIELYY